MTIVKEITRHFSGQPSFTYNDVKLYLKGKRIRTKNLSRLISHMKSSGMVNAIRKGVYTFDKNIMVAGFAYAPFYYGLLSALTIRDLWTQNARPEVMTVRKVRASRMHVLGDKNAIIFIHHIPAKYFFGFDTINYGNVKIPVSDPEKTLIDLFYYKTRLPIQNYALLLKAVNQKKIRGYLKAYDRRVSKVVLSFLSKYKRLADAGKLESPY